MAFLGTWFSIHFFSFIPKLWGKMNPFLTNIFFQMGWFNHQLAFSWLVDGGGYSTNYLYTYLEGSPSNRLFRDNDGYLIKASYFRYILRENLALRGVPVDSHDTVGFFL